MNVFDHILRHGSDASFVPSRAGEPTQAPPGSYAKRAVIARRVERGEQLFHPNDAPLGGLEIEPGKHHFKKDWT